MGEYKKITVFRENGNGEDIEVDYPDTCPICHHGIDARFIYAYLGIGGMRAEVVYQCPRFQCRRLFIGSYLKLKMEIDPEFFEVGDAPKVLYRLDRIIPVGYMSREFSEDITLLSGDFVEIYEQSTRAEALDLHAIAGPGYRKSLEFLIKDYAISRDPAKADVIKEKPLSGVITDHIDDAKIKDMASRATWLGNDETHYYRKWLDADIDDLKMLIDLTVHWIESEKITERYKKKMPIGKK